MTPIVWTFAGLAVSLSSYWIGERGSGVRVVITLIGFALCLVGLAVAVLS